MKRRRLAAESTPRRASSIAAARAGYGSHRVARETAPRACVDFRALVKLGTGWAVVPKKPQKC